MRQSYFFILIAVLSALEATATQISSKRQSNSCTREEFVQDGDALTTVSNVTHIVSQGRVCTPGSSDPIEQCTVSSDGTVEEEPTFEIDNNTFVDPNFFRTLLIFVARDADLGWDGPASAEGLSGETRGFNWTLEAGQSGYLAFTADLWCVEGTLCHPDGNITEPTRVRSCFPRRSEVGPGDIAGRTSFVVTDEETARNLTQNPALVEPDDEGVAGTLDVALAKCYAMFAVFVAIFVSLGF